MTLQVKFSHFDRVFNRFDLSKSFFGATEFDPLVEDYSDEFLGCEAVRPAWESVRPSTAGGATVDALDSLASNAGRSFAAPGKSCQSVRIFFLPWLL